MKKKEFITDLLYFSLLILVIAVLLSSCSTNQYAVDCYNNDKLEYRKIQNYLWNIQDTSKYEKCEVYRLGDKK